MPESPHITKSNNMYAAFFENRSIKDGEAVTAPRITLRAQFKTRNGVQYSNFIFPAEIDHAIEALQKMKAWLTEMHHRGDVDEVSMPPQCPHRDS